jgi:hypothetical protein
VAIALAAIMLVAGVSACGGGGTETRDEVAVQVEAACSTLAGFSVWLPEHLAKTHGSIAEAEAILRKAEGEFGSALASLDPPSALQAPLERLASESPEADGGSRSATISYLEREADLYRQVGATSCAKGVQASILSLEGASVPDAYRQVGVPLPQRPDGW